ncbi:MAG: ParB/RepB/Spo0J family partition protein [Lachnospiraceae bacterium]|nr:ParB/RepB/Spo0J family partition protein [Lachnospiraceae bacterium]
MLTTNFTTDSDVERLRPHPDNPRKDLGDLTELAESIKKNGVMQNLTVIPQDENGTGYYYTVLIGHRRLAAAKLAGLKQVPCRIAMDVSEQEQQLIMLEENMQRNDLTPLEQAESFQMVLDLGSTVNEIAEKTGFSKTTVYHRLAIAKLDREKVKAATSGEKGWQMDLSDFIELEKVKDIKKREELLDKAFSPKDLRSRIQDEVEQEKRDKAREAIEFQLEAAGVSRAPKGTENQIWSDKWERVARFDLNQPIPEKIDASKMDGAVYASNTWVLFVLKKAEKKEAEVSEAAKKEKEEKRRIKEMRKLMDRMTEDRTRALWEAIDSGKISRMKLEDMDDSLRRCCRSLYCAGAGVSVRHVNSFLSKALWDEEYWSLKEEDREIIKEKEEGLGIYKKMLICASEALKDNQSSSTRLWGYGAEYNKEAAGAHREMLVALDIAFGFKYDAEEMALIEGTHELYMK